MRRCPATPRSIENLHLQDAYSNNSNNTCLRFRLEFLKRLMRSSFNLIDYHGSSYRAQMLYKISELLCSRPLTCFTYMEPRRQTYFSKKTLWWKQQISPNYKEKSYPTQEKTVRCYVNTVISHGSHDSFWSVRSHSSTSFFNVVANENTIWVNTIVYTKADKYWFSLFTTIVRRKLLIKIKNTEQSIPWGIASRTSPRYRKAFFEKSRDVKLESFKTKKEQKILREEWKLFENSVAVWDCYFV